MKARRALSTAQKLLGERTPCGAELTLCKLKTRATPYWHGCRCSKLWSSDAVCHRCACVACAKLRAKWAAGLEKAKKRST